MNENDLFNKDSMYWREVNFSSPDTTAELEFVEPITIEDKTVQTIVCSLHPFESHVVEYQMDNDGGAFTKNEVKDWPFVLISDLAFYNDQANSEEERQLKLRSVSHSNVQSISLKNKAGKIVLKKEKI